MSYTLEKLEKVALYISTLSDNWLSSQLVQNKYLQPEIIQFIAAEKFNTFDSKLKTSLLLATLSTSKRLISDSFTLAALSLSKVALQDPDETVRIAAVLVDSYINNQTVLDFDRITAQFPLLNELTDQYNKSKAQLPFASYVALLNKDLVTYTKQEPKKFTLNFRNKEPVESRLQKYIDSGKFI